MGILDKARQAAEQAADATRVAADEARRRAEGAATTVGTTVADLPPGSDLIELPPDPPGIRAD